LLGAQPQLDFVLDTKKEEKEEGKKMANVSLSSAGTRSECEQFFISKPDHNNGQSLLCDGGRSRDRLPIPSKFA